MKIALSTAAALALVAALAPAALAQPAVTPVAPPPTPTSSEPPPAGGDGSDLSHINGQLVKVGEHNEYYYRFRRTMISSNPLGWMFGFYGLSVSHAFSDHMAVRVDGNLYNDVFGEGGDGYELGVGLPIYFRRAYQGLFLEPGFIAREMGSSWDDSTYREVGPQVLVGYGWVWDSGFSAQVAFGGGRNLADNSDGEYDYDDDRSEPFANGYLRFGYAF
ncbi:MAG TPA: hypothetical protein VMZ28_00435 [Kofleriaceae bacterium]|nr:hypothetical protein [Kofleriaceae bacterium]